MANYKRDFVVVQKWEKPQIKNNKTFNTGVKSAEAILPKAYSVRHVIGSNNATFQSQKVKKSKKATTTTKYNTWLREQRQSGGKLEKRGRGNVQAEIHMHERVHSGYQPPVDLKN